MVVIRNILFLTLLLMSTCTLQSVFAQRWEKVTNIQPEYNLPTDYYLDIYFLPSDPLFGWACGYSGKTIRTTDGGISWIGSTILNGAMLESIHFVSPSIGYTSGPDGIFKSIDGGATWTSISNGLGGGLWGLYFLSEDYGIAIGGGCDTNQRFNITTNGGTTWSTSQYSVPNTGLTDVILLSDGVGFASSSGRIWKSLDSGRTWNIAATTGDVGWQEEITFVNGSMAVPTAGDNCTGGTNGSLRFSIDSGLTWRTFNVPTNMFGTFVLDSVTAWGCGLGGAIYYTENAGISWHLKNCGIGTADLDDVFFVEGNNGWVVGNGVFRLAPASRTISRNQIDFGTICIPGSKLELVGAVNTSFSDVTVTTTLLTNDDNAFLIVNQDQQPFAIGNCEQRSIGLLFQPTSEGPKTCTLQIAFSSGESYTVTATGDATTRKSIPADTIVFFDTTQCNTLQYVNALWYNTGNVEENISTVTKDSGSSSILYLSPPTLRVPPRDSINIVYSVIPLDTGWISTRYSFKVEPCNNSSYQHLFVYGKSAIITAEDTLKFRSTCDQVSLDSILIKNTGNDTLIINNPRLLGIQSTAFELVSFSDGTNSLLSKKIAPNDSIYLIIKFLSTFTGNVSAQLEFFTNDSTKVRGNKAIYKGTLLGFWGAPDLASDKKNLDFDSICVQSYKSDTVTIYNNGVVSSDFVPFDYDTTNFILTPVFGNFPVLIPPQDSASIVVTSHPQQRGLIRDTIWLVSNNCASEKFIVASVFGKEGVLLASPSTITHQIIQSSFDSASVIITNVGNIPVEVNSISFVPTNQKLEIVFPKNPKIVAPNDTFSILYKYTASLRETIQSTIEIVSTSENCTQPLQIPVVIRGVGSMLSASDSIMNLEQRCSTSTVCKPLSIINQGIAPDTIKSVQIISNSTNPVTLINPFVIGTLIRAEETLSMSVCFTATQEGVQNDTIIINTANSDKPIIVVVNASYYRTNTTIEDTLIDFGIVHICDSIQTISKLLVNSGSLNDTLDFIPSLSVLSPHWIAPTELLIHGSDSALFSLSNNPTNFESVSEGLYTATFTYRSRICGNLIVVQVQTLYQHPTITMSKNTIDFGTLWMDEVRTDSILLTNTSTNPITILQGIFDYTELGFRTNPLDFPITILPDSSYQLKVVFTATVEGTSTARLQLSLQSVCTDSLFVDVTATVTFEEYSAAFGLEDKTGMPGEEIIFPLFLYDSLSKAKIDSIDFAISFDERLLSPKGILLPWTFPPRFIPYVFQNDILTFSVPQNETFDLGRQPMQLARIVTRALLNKPDRTPLKFLSITPRTTKRVNTSFKNGSFLINVCGIRGGLDYLPTATVAIPHPIVTSPSLDISLLSTGEQFVDIELYSLLGVPLTTVRRQLTPNQEHEVSMPLGQNGNGTYFLVVKTQYGETFQKQIILQR